MKKIESFKKIVNEKQIGQVENQRVDLYSASAVMAVYNGLNEANRAKFLALSVEKMITVSFKVLKG